jgi:sugar/nucleoside kinase (ribokinase family)
MTDEKLAAAAIESLTQTLGLPALPVDEIAQYSALLVGLLRGKSWQDAIAAGVAAREKIQTEADAERSRRARMEDK